MSHWVSPDKQVCFDPETWMGPFLNCLARQRLQIWHICCCKSHEIGATLP